MSLHRLLCCILKAGVAHGGNFPVQVSRRYYNAHALVDVTVSAVFDPPLQQGEPESNTKITEAKIVVSTPTVIGKGAAL